MTLPELLETLARGASPRFLLIGGHAVIAHGYARTTFDVDFLVCREDVEEWLALLIKQGYKVAGQERAFVQFTAPSGGENVDLMIVNDTTFEGIWQGALPKNIGTHEVRIPSLDHLLALKLHVLKQNLGHRVIKDLDDVIRLVLANRLDLESKHYQRLFEKYGTRETYERVLKATSISGE